MEEFIQTDSELDKIKQLVEQRLQKAQQGKVYKDEGRKAGSRKERIAYQVISLQNLSDIEDDPALAEKLTTKARVWPEINIEQEKAAGTTSGACYLKYQLHRALAAKPFNSKQARKIYVTALTVFQDLLKEAKGAKQVEETAAQLFSDTGLKSILPEIAQMDYKTDNSYNYRYFHSDKTTLIAESVFGKSFINLARRKYGSDAVRQKFMNAVLYDAFTEEQQQKYVDYRKEQAEIYATRMQSEIDANNAMDDAALYRELKSRFSFITKPEFEKEPAQKWKDQLNGYITNAIARNRNFSIPVQYQARSENWAWAYEKKERKEAEKSELPRINSGPYMSNIVRKNGLLVNQIGTKGVKERWGLAAVQYGNGLNDKESEILTYWLNGAFSDLEEVLNINLQKLNSLGALGLDFATRGTAGQAASYWSDYKVINLTKRNGDGSVAHEWGHFLDNFLSVIVPDENKVKLNGHFGAFASEFSAADADIDKEVKTLMHFINKGDGTQTVKVKFTAANHNLSITDKGGLDATILYYQQTYPGNFKDAKRRSQIIGNILYNLQIPEAEIEVKINTSVQYYNSERAGNKNYWCSNVEMFARAFEMYVTTKLEERDQLNNFLQANRDYWRVYGIFPYPDGKEREFTNACFDRIFSLLRTKYSVQPVSLFDGERITEDVPNSTLVGDKNLQESAVEKQEPEQTKEEAEADVIEEIKQPVIVTPAKQPEQNTTELIEALKLSYEIDSDPKTLELIEALELTETV